MTPSLMMEGINCNKAQKAAITCAEDIAALFLLHQPKQVVADPSQNRDTHSLPEQSEYVLPFEVERRLTGAFAFLSGRTHGPNNVTAVCILEAPEAPPCLKVMVAVNRQNARDGSHVLDCLRAEFENIFALLAQVEGRNQEIKSKIFTAIVSMRTNRILCRLGLAPKHNGKRNTPIWEVLNLILDYFQASPFSEIERRQQPPFLQSFIKEATLLNKELDRFRKGSRLETVVKSISQLESTGDINSLISTIPTRTLNPVLGKSFVKMLNTVTRYYEVARYLYRTARDIPVVRNMRFFAVELPKETFNRVPAGNCDPKLKGIIGTRDLLTGYQPSTARICTALNVSEKGANFQLARQAQKTLREGKIHAEIQLIYYCELNASTVPLWPRVVRSSKDACWLCNAFILSHGKVFTSRCHGRLYPGWRLPLLGGPSVSIADAFNRKLEEQISKSLVLAMRGRNRMKYTQPNESTLSVLSHVPSTSSEDGDDSPFPPFTEKWEDGPITASNDPTLQAREVITSNRSGSESSPSCSVMSNDSASAVTNDGSHHLPDVSMLNSKEPIVSVDAILHTMAPQSRQLCLGETSPMYAVGDLEVQVEYAEGSETKTTENKGGRLSLYVEQLTVEEAAVLEVNEEVRILDAELLGKDELPCQTGDPAVIYLRAGSSVLRVTLTKIV